MQDSPSYPVPHGRAEGIEEGDIVRLRCKKATRTNAPLGVIRWLPSGLVNGTFRVARYSEKYDVALVEVIDGVQPLRVAYALMGEDEKELLAGFFRVAGNALKVVSRPPKETESV